MKILKQVTLIKGMKGNKLQVFSDLFKENDTLFELVDEDNVESQFFGTKKSIAKESVKITLTIESI